MNNIKFFFKIIENFENEYINSEQPKIIKEKLEQIIKNKKYFSYNCNNNYSALKLQKKEGKEEEEEEEESEEKPKKEKDKKSNNKKKEIEEEDDDEEEEEEEDEEETENNKKKKLKDTKKKINDEKMEKEDENERPIKQNNFNPNKWDEEDGNIGDLAVNPHSNINIEENVSIKEQWR